MEMQVNIELIKRERAKRAWSKTQLADVSGLSLRTIQRIEKTGAASLESVMSIASVLELDVSDLQKKQHFTLKSLNTKLSVMLSAISMVITSFFVMTATAQPVMFDLTLKSHGKILAEFQILNKENAESEMLMSNNLKILLTSSIEDQDNVRISTKIFDISSGREVLIASPIMMTKQQEKAEIHVGDFELSLTPHL